MASQFVTGPLIPRIAEVRNAYEQPGSLGKAPEFAIVSTLGRRSAISFSHAVIRKGESGHPYLSMRKWNRDLQE